MPVHPDEVVPLLMLADGTMSSAEIGLNASEHEIRNALSRCYYALMHACRAWLIIHGEPASNSMSHKVLQAKIGNKRGPAARERLIAIYRVRFAADYTPDMLTAGPYYGDLEKFRIMAMSKVEAARQEMRLYRDEVDQYLSENATRLSHG